MAATRDSLLAAIDKALEAADLFAKLTEIKIDDTVIALLRWGRTSDLFLNLLARRFAVIPAGAAAAAPITEDEIKTALRQFIVDTHQPAPEGAQAKFGDGVLLGKLIDKLPMIFQLISLFGGPKIPLPG